MKKYIEILKNTQLFNGISKEEISLMLGCLQGEIKKYKKDEFIYTGGEKINKIAILLSGKLHISKDDYWGNRSIISAVEPSDMFGESYIAKEEVNILNDVIAVKDSEVAFFDAKKVLTVCPNACRFHSYIVENLFFILCNKNRNLVGKLHHMSKRSIREKLISYLSEQSAKLKKSTFEIPFNRQELADYLSVDRSALSKELCKMRDDGLIKFSKNRFTLLN